jgi:hypothetical protein
LTYFAKEAAILLKNNEKILCLVRMLFILQERRKKKESHSTTTEEVAQSELGREILRVRKLCRCHQAAEKVIGPSYKTLRHLQK